MPSILTKWDIDMINLDIQWGEPYQMADEKGMWRREWLIPTEYRNPFFVYWKTNNFKLKDKGYSVSKRDNDWYLIETQTTKDQFSKSKANKKELISEDVVLKPHVMKHSDGLRPWQVESVAKLCSVINKWGCGIDGSDVGIGKTYVACGVARELDMDILIVCPKAVMESWKRVIFNHFKMIYDPDHRCNFIMHYYHGSGGGGPVTKGVIQDQRILASIEGYDCTWQGHVHELYYHQNIVNRYVRTTHQILQKPVHQVRTATYKEEWADGYMTF